MAKKRFQQKTNKKTNDKRKIKEEHVWDRIFLLQIRKSLLVIVIWVLSMIVHSLILRFAGIDEPFFATLALWIIPVYLLISIIYTLSKHKRIEG
jgi:hypothetical protein